jgi:hypothetical protein
MAERSLCFQGLQPAEEFSTLMHEIAHLCGAEVYVALTSGTRVEACVRRGQAPHNLSLDVHARREPAVLTVFPILLPQTPA